MSNATDWRTGDPQRVLEEGEQHWAESHATIRWIARPYVLDFRVREGTKQDDGSIWYRYDDGDWGDDFEKAERFVEGSIKWDGCSHINFGDEDGYVHLCGARHFLALATALASAFRIASEKVPAFDAATADLDRLPPRSPHQERP